MEILTLAGASTAAITTASAQTDAVTITGTGTIADTSTCYIYTGSSTPCPVGQKISITTTPSNWISAPWLSGWYTYYSPTTIIVNGSSVTHLMAYEEQLSIFPTKIALRIYFNSGGSLYLDLDGASFSPAPAFSLKQNVSGVSNIRFSSTVPTYSINGLPIYFSLSTESGNFTFGGATIPSKALGDCGCLQRGDPQVGP
jgi:hypothetical protein